MERKNDPNFDMRLDRIEVNDSEEDQNVSNQNFYLTQRKSIPYLDTEKFFSNKLNLIHKAKQLILKEKKLKEKHFIGSESQNAKFAKTASTFYNCDTRNNNFLFRNTTTKPNWMVFEEKLVGNSSDFKVKKRRSVSKLTPFQKKTQSNDIFKTMLKEKQVINQRKEKNLCVTSRSMEGGCDSRSAEKSNSLPINQKKIISKSYVSFKKANPKFSKSFMSSTGFNRTKASSLNGFDKTMSSSASFKNLIASGGFKGGTGSKLFHKSAASVNKMSRSGGKGLNNETGRELNEITNFTLINRFRSGDFSRGGENGSQLNLNKKGLSHLNSPLKISNLNELFREGENILNLNLKDLKIRQTSVKKIKMAILEIDYKKG